MHSSHMGISSQSDASSPVDNEAQQAISVRGAWKSYGSKKRPQKVLKGLNMDVSQGSIFALLGPSGCGKTTLLSCILSLRKLDTGDIRVYGKIPGTRESGIPGWRVGYMPQETALYKEFTIREIFFLFGRIYALSSDSITQKMDFLINFLQLPKPSRPVKSLSAGQQRRVSFGVSLLHNPELLVLDEPTVGVDPILRKKIWDYLVNLTSPGNVTVLITTHYIEEARQAHKAGFMDDGILLAEAAPQKLLSEFSADTLEEVFHSLVLGSESLPANSSNTQVHENANRYRHKRLNGNKFPESAAEPIDFNEAWWHPLSRIHAIHMQSYRRFWKNPLLVIFMMVFPVLATVCMLIIFRDKPNNIHVGVFNGEYPQDPICDVYSDCLFSNLSCRYLDSVDKAALTLIPYGAEKDLLEDVKQQHIRAAILFSANFSDSLTEDWIQEDAFKNSSKIIVHIDQTNFFVATAVRREIVDTYEKFINEFLRVCELEDLNKGQPMELTSASGLDEFRFADFQIAGLMPIVSFFFTCIYATSYFVSDVREGVLDRMIVSGVTVGEFVSGMMLHQCTAMAIHVTLMFITVYAIFQATIVGSVAILFTLTVFHGICAVAYGMALASCISDEKAVFQVIFIYEIMSCFLSGILWPIEVMPIAVRYLSYYAMASPLVIDAGKALAAKQYSITHRLIWPGFASNIVWIVIFMALLYFNLRRRNMSLFQCGKRA